MTSRLRFPPRLYLFMITYKKDISLSMHNWSLQEKYTTWSNNSSLRRVSLPSMPIVRQPHDHSYFRKSLYHSRLLFFASLSPPDTLDFNFKTTHAYNTRTRRQYLLFIFEGIPQEVRVLSLHIIPGDVTEMLFGHPVHEINHLFFQVEHRAFKTCSLWGTYYQAMSRRILNICKKYRQRALYDLLDTYLYWGTSIFYRTTVKPD